MFNVSYDPKTGEILSYQEGPTDKDHLPDEGSKTLSFESSAGAFDDHGVLAVKVDPATETLVSLKALPSAIKKTK